MLNSYKYIILKTLLASTHKKRYIKRVMQSTVNPYNDCIHYIIYVYMSVSLFPYTLESEKGGGGVVIATIYYYMMLCYLWLYM